MNASYRLGLILIAATVALAAVVAPGLPLRLTPPVAEDLSDEPRPLGAFRLTERSGRAISEADLIDRVWVAAFIFTRCPSSCPKISAVMKDLQGRLAGTGVRLVSLSVDPEHDTPAVLADYALRFGADPDRWWFLTGPKAAHDEFLGRFGLGVPRADPDGPASGGEAIAHSARLVLVDRGNRVVGYFDSDEPEAVARLVAAARKKDRAWVARLPALNAALNTACAVLLLTGWRQVRRGRVRAHIRCMATALAVSALFLTSYLVYHYQAGSVPFRGVGPVRWVYFTVLLSHTILAVAVVPLVAWTLAHALRGRFEAHVKIARVTFPIWLYVSITGVIVYGMLYHLKVAPYPL